MATIAPIVARYAEVEVIYQREPETTLKHNFEMSLIDFYTSILVYQLTAACHCRRSTLSRFLRAPFKSDDWDAMLQTVRDKDAARKEFDQIYDSLDQRVAATSLQTIFGAFDKKMELMEAAFKELNTVERISASTSLEPPPPLQYPAGTIRTSWNKLRWGRIMQTLENGCSVVRTFSIGCRLQLSNTASGCVDQCGRRSLRWSQVS